MSDNLTLQVNGRPVAFRPGMTVAAAVAGAGAGAGPRSPFGLERGPLCGMGIFHECRVTIDGVPHQRSCQTACRAGMEVRTDGP